MKTNHSELIKKRVAAGLGFIFLIDVGLHTFVNINDTVEFAVGSFRGSDIGVARCIIPKGSKYYSGYFDKHVSYASDVLKVDRIVLADKANEVFGTDKIKDC